MTSTERMSLFHKLLLLSIFKDFLDLPCILKSYFLKLIWKSVTCYLSKEVHTLLIKSNAVDNLSWISCSHCLPSSPDGSADGLPCIQLEMLMQGALLKLLQPASSLPPLHSWFLCCVWFIRVISIVMIAYFIMYSRGIHSVPKGYLQLPVLVFTWWHMKEQGGSRRTEPYS